MEGMIGEVRLFAGNFAPRTWAFCQGQLLPINQNSALFSILGTIYGGDGRSTFALPDLRGRVPLGAGQGPGLSNYREGAKGGQEFVTLTVAQMPVHNHGLTGNIKISVADQKGDTASAKNRPLAKVAQDITTKSTDLIEIYANNATFNDGFTLGGVSNDLAVANNGANQAVNNLQPFLAINFVICVHGMFPSRN